MRPNMSENSIFLTHYLSVCPLICTFAPKPEQLIITPMITIEEMQFGGMLTMTMLTLMLLGCVPRRSAKHPGFGWGRWMMAAGTALVALQFMLQHIYGFRAMGVTQAVFWNLLMFVPSTILINMAMLNIQQRGLVGRKEKLLGAALCLINTVVLVATLLADGVPLESESVWLARAEYVSALLFMLMQSYYLRIFFKNYLRLQRAVDEFFDRKRTDLLGWMGRSILLLALLGILLPVAIFFQGPPLTVFSVFMFFCIAYCVMSFYSYGISSDVIRVEESEDVDDEAAIALNGPDESPAMDAKESEQIAHAVEQWMNSDAYCEHNLTLNTVARQMHVSRKKLQLWLRQSEYGKLATLVTTLRIERAKELLKENPNWTIDSVASHCGFNSRKYFHQVFMEQTGTTPARYHSNL